MLSLKVSLHMSHLSTALKLLLTYSSTPPAPCPSGFWFSRSFLNNLYPSKASSLSAILGLYVLQDLRRICSDGHRTSWQMLFNLEKCSREEKPRYMKWDQGHWDFLFGNSRG